MEYGRPCMQTQLPRARNPRARRSQRGWSDLPGGRTTSGEPAWFFRNTSANAVLHRAFPLRISVTPGVVASRFVFPLRRAYPFRETLCSTCSIDWRESLPSARARDAVFAMDACEHNTDLFLFLYTNDILTMLLDDIMPYQPDKLCVMNAPTWYSDTPSCTSHDANV